MAVQPPFPNMPSQAPVQRERIDRLRYLRLTSFFARVILQIIFWDLLIGRIWVIGPIVKGRRDRRLRRVARRFRLLAIDMGGVMIKLGQFLSVRVDVLPPEIIEELLGLQDAVPPVPLSQIQSTLHDELGDPLRYFVRFEEEPLAAASLGQTHRAWLRSMQNPQEGEPVVVKVQRPNIETLVRTDLSALERVSGWVMKYRPIRRRANVPALLDEFGLTLWEELDYRLELENARHFAEIFAETDEVYVPQFFDRYCTTRILTIENVESMKISEVEAIAAAGVDPKQVADRLLDSYFKQVFDASFFHADPHPGNVFLRARPDRPHAPNEPTPFEIIFIDFGMMGRIPSETRSELQKLLIGVTTRDGRAVTQAYDRLGFFLPDADLDRIAEAQERVLDQIWGRDLFELANPDANEVADLGNEFRDLVFDFPFQIPQNFIYLGRATTILSGIAAILNPTINPWHYVEVFGKRLVTRREIAQTGVSAVYETLREYAAIPAQLKRILSDAERGKFKVRIQADRQLEQRLERVERKSRQLGASVVAVGLLLSGTVLYVGESADLGLTFWAIAAVLQLITTLRNR